MSSEKELLYTTEHEWVKIEDDIATVGISNFAQSELGDIIFVELNDSSEALSIGDVFGTIEAVKTVADLFMPINGKIIEINPLIETQPELINSSPFNDGWIIKIKINNDCVSNDLLSFDDYQKLING